MTTTQTPERKTLEIGDFASIGEGIAGTVIAIDETTVTIQVPQRHNGKEFFVSNLIGCTRLVPAEWIDQARLEERSTQRSVEASPLPGDVISALRLLVDVYTQNDEKVVFTVQYIPLPPYIDGKQFADAWGLLREFLANPERHREQATAPLREALDDIECFVKDRISAGEFQRLGAEWVLTRIQQSQSKV
jgi:hypothetical protein